MQSPDDFAIAKWLLIVRLNRVRSLSIVLQDVDISLSEYELNDKQQTHLLAIYSSCHNVLEKLVMTLEKYREEHCDGSLNIGAKWVWKRLKWEPEDVRELRDRITSIVTLFNTFLGGISKYLCPYSIDLTSSC